jgi:hypothetical protein
VGSLSFRLTQHGGAARATFRYLKPRTGTQRASLMPKRITALNQPGTKSALRINASAFMSAQCIVDSLSYSRKVVPCVFVV